MSCRWSRHDHETYLEIVEQKCRRVSFGLSVISDVRMGKMDAKNALRVPPNPTTGWNCWPSLTTMSAAAAGPGLTKFTGFEPRLSYVNSFAISHVVEYWEQGVRSVIRLGRQ